MHKRLKQRLGVSIILFLLVAASVYGVGYRAGLFVPINVQPRAQAVADALEQGTHDFSCDESTPCPTKHDVVREYDKVTVKLTFDTPPTKHLSPKIAPALCTSLHNALQAKLKNYPGDVKAGACAYQDGVSILIEAIDKNGKTHLTTPIKCSTCR